MKKFIIISSVLIILGGTAFIFGWLQIFIPPDTYCVAFTKTGGFDTFVTEPGKFSWRWERLIPTNMTLYKFKLNPVEKNINIKGELPSGGIYSTVLPGSPEFTYNFDLRIAFMLNPESLPMLVSEKHLRPDTIGQWYGTLANSAFHFIAEQLIDLQNADEYYHDSNVIQNLKKAIEKQYPFLIVSDITVKDVSLPDIELYKKAKKIYFDISEAEEESQKNVIKQTEADRAKRMILQDKEKEKIEMYKEYGKLLNDYPILLKYFSIKNQDKNNLNIPDVKLPETKNAE
ncbi:MAG: hypothetical protein GXP33_13515 [Spirochaetes bacterium]|nr:hypothetical protein [Spirochaetota bacterium]